MGMFCYFQVVEQWGMICVGDAGEDGSGEQYCSVELISSEWVEVCEDDGGTGDPCIDYGYCGNDEDDCIIYGGCQENPNDPSAPTQAQLELLAQLENEYRNHMTTKEKQIYDTMYFHMKLAYLMNAKESLDKANSLYPGNQTDSKADAFRHAYFSMLNVQFLGPVLAKGLGDAHEEAPGQTALAKQMDLHNNQAGRDAHTFLGLNTEQKIIDLIDNGTLRYIKNGVLTPTNQ